MLQSAVRRRTNIEQRLFYDFKRIFGLFGFCEITIDEIVEEAIKKKANTGIEFRS